MLLERLQRHTGLSVSQLDRYAQTASKRYRVYTVEKRDGSPRRIEHPSREIKAIQRWLVRALISQLPVHQSATAYAKGMGIRCNAERHVESRYTVRLDFQAFFPSFRGGHVEAYLRATTMPEGIVLTEQDLTFVRMIVCRNDVLTIGAPSSPGLTNAMMFSFDEALSDWCAQRNLIYTRYADDLFISASEAGRLADVEAEVERLAGSFVFGRLALNRDKTAHLSRKYHRSITGLVITPTGSISIGRDSKVQIKSAVHAYSKGKLDPGERGRAAGKVAFVKDVEPQFYDTLIRKYGRETVENLQRGLRPSLKQ